MVFTRGMRALILALVLLASACSGDSSDATVSDDTGDGGSEQEDNEASEPEETEETAATTTTTTTTEAPEETTTSEAAEAEPEQEEEATEEESAATAGAQAVDLGEWFVDTADSLDAGTLTFAVSNGGENPHAFAIVRGNAYEELPLLENGAVDTETLGADFLGSTDNLMTGESTEIEFELEAGNYVFFCPVQFGPNSHAAAGQVLSVTVG